MINDNYGNDEEKKTRITRGKRQQGETKNKEKSNKDRFTDTNKTEATTGQPRRGGHSAGHDKKDEMKAVENDKDREYKKSKEA